MGPSLKAYFIERIFTSIQSVSSQIFPQIAKIILDHKCNDNFELRGQTIQGEPVGHIIDANTECFEKVAEFGKVKKYFEDKKNKKIKQDFKHCLNVAPQCLEIYLLSSASCGPKKYTLLNRAAQIIGRRINKEIYVFDGRTISTYIVEEFFDKHNVPELEKLNQFMPLIDQIKNEFGFSNDFPKLPDNNIVRATTVNSCMKKLHENKLVQLYGISGSGKTYLALQIAERIRKIDPDQMTIWISGESIKEASDLKSLKIDRYGVPQNIIGLMQRFKSLVIIDSLERKINEIISTITTEVTNEYNLIITSQIAASHHSKLRIKESGKSLSKKILNRGLTVLCPDETFKEIYSSIGGHPFLLNQINILIKENHLTWSSVVEELEYITLSETDDNQVFYNRLFQNHLTSIKNELAVLKWIDEKEMEHSLLHLLIGTTGIKKLDSRDIFNIYNNGSYILHDIVLRSLNNIDLKIEEQKNEIAFQKRLEKMHKEFDLRYFRIIHSHKKLIKRILTQQKQHNIFYYSHLISSTLGEFDSNIVSAYDLSRVEKSIKDYKDADYYFLLSWIEEIEIKYRIFKKEQKHEDVTEFMQTNIEFISKLLDESNNKLPVKVSLDLRNHLGKFLRNAKRLDEAISCFEKILVIEPNFCAAKFHLAKLLRRTDPNKAKQYLLDILNQYDQVKNISSTIVLATFIEMRSHPDLDSILISKFIDTFNTLVMETMVSKFDLPYEVLGALSSKIHFHFPEKMLELAQNLPIPSEEELENNTLFYIGQIYFNAAKACAYLENRRFSAEYSDQALAYYSKLTSPDHFQLRIIAETYLNAGKGSDSLNTLYKVKVERREMWWNYTYAKTLRVLLRFSEALKEIEKTIGYDSEGKQIAIFFKERGLIKFELGDKNYIKDYKEAIIHSEIKFKSILEKELDDLKARLD
jgi:tetratricopeptide (TPR) repeat protein